ncbi:ATP-binding protein [Flavobacterium selenitireducens]|uniref:ATP-binding protein n=1 Tax=Flavobacterium selenitireducens TaxID=2722704 RepID=UPI00168AEF18|nr:ATP-binding protein [Flavobacterium selenitireducens]MBD3583057.1 PAS domain-containing protein [Flavobacterium selenitireducens]
MRKNRRNAFDWFAKRPRTSGGLVSALSLIVLTVIAIQRYQMARADEQREMYQILDATHNNLEQALKNCYATSITLAMTINDQGIPEHFDEIAPKLLQSNPVINAVEMVPGGVITQVYPTIGNEGAIGFNILESEQLRPEALRSLKSGKMYFAGPLELQQGGSGIVGRMPVYQNRQFWGFTAVLIHPETLYRTTGLTSIDESRYFFQLRKTQSQPGQKKYFFEGDDQYKNKYHVTKMIPDGGWELILAARESHAAIWAVVPVVLFGIGLSIILGFLINMLLSRPAEAARQSEERFESLFNNSPVALWEEDFSLVKEYLQQIGLIGQRPDYIEKFLGENPDEVEKCLSLVTIINVNNECLKLHYPKTREELMSKSLTSIMGSQTNEDFVNQLNAVAMGLPKINMDTRMSDGKGGHREIFLQWTVMAGYEESLGRVIVATEDITERKEAQRLVSESQHRIEGLIDTIDGIVWESDFANDNISFVNAKAEEITGYPIDQWLSEPNFWTNHIHPDDREKTLRTYHHNVTRAVQFEIEYRFIKKDGRTVWIKDYVNVITESGRPMYVRGIMMDRTKSMEADRKLNESLKLVIEQNKRLQNFSYIVSHNLRSHTSNIQSIASLMDAADSPEEKRQMIGMLRTVSASLNETMTNLNEVVNIQNNISLVAEKLNVRHYVEMALSILSEQIAIKSADIRIDVPRSAEILFNPAYFESVMLNLISNAIRYSGTESAPEIHVIWSESDAGKTLSVSDNGIGIDLVKNAEKIFGMYQTFSNNPESKGIGLFITKNQIEAMGGTIEVESEPGQGTKFTIRFK